MSRPSPTGTGTPAPPVPAARIAPPTWTDPPAGSVLPARPLVAVDDVDVIAPSEVVATKRVVADDPYLSGHYPDFPIYPGVFVVESACQAVAELVRRTRGVAVALTAVDSARFTAPLTPGDTLRVHASLDDSLTATVTCTRDDSEPAAQLRLRFRGDLATVDEPVDPVRDPAGRTTVRQHADLLALLPHRHPILLVDRVVAVAGARTETVKTVSGSEPCFAGAEGHPYPPTLLLESFVQSAAVAWELGRGGPSGQDTLVLGGVRDAVFHAAAYPGDVVRHVVELEQVVGSNAVLTGRSHFQGTGLPVLTVRSVVLSRRPLRAGRAAS